jgi:hypothetical protein
MISRTSSVVYRVDWRYEDFQTGKVLTGTLRNRYKSAVGAMKAAQARCWVTQEYDRPPVCASTATIREEVVRA